jgi:hypothetical protein
MIGFLEKNKKNKKRVTRGSDFRIRTSMAKLSSSIIELEEFKKKAGPPPGMADACGTRNGQETVSLNVPTNSDGLPRQARDKRKKESKAGYCSALQVPG